jgi:hypothetical protein
MFIDHRAALPRVPLAEVRFRSVARSTLFLLPPSRPGSPLRFFFRRSHSWPPRQSQGNLLTHLSLVQFAGLIRQGLFESLNPFFFRCNGPWTFPVVRFSLRFGALGKHGSIAVLERAVRTIKEALQRIMVPTRREAMRTELVRQHCPARPF